MFASTSQGGLHRALTIDQSFISDLETNQDSRAIVEAIINLARDLRMSVAAEGIETRAQFDMLQQLGCGEIQGSLVGRPRPVDRFEDYLRENGSAVERLYA
jgi:EAL domain-containing protein (putative c-di-GMP-specific phosphodiesterase class I)